MDDARDRVKKTAHSLPDVYYHSAHHCPSKPSHSYADHSGHMSPLKYSNSMLVAFIGNKDSTLSTPLSIALPAASLSPTPNVLSQNTRRGEADQLFNSLQHPKDHASVINGLVPIETRSRQL